MLIFKDENADSDSDGSDDSMEDDESKLMNKYIEILQKIEVNKYNYNDYVQLVEVAQ